MFYNKRKTIGVFLNRAELEFQQVLSRSLTETAKQCDYNIVYLTSFGIRETETMYDLYEKNVVDFAPIEEYIRYTQLSNETDRRSEKQSAWSGHQFS